jgi:hypothetical protein
MTPIKFPGVNVIFGENQPEYQPLPAMRLPDGQVITCWQLSDEEIEKISQNRCIYLQQLVGKQRLQPILPLADLGDDISLIPDNT